MKAKELMVDDWTMHHISKEPMKVRYVFDDGIEVSGGQFDDDYIDPIPLTQEILEVNNFELNHFEKWQNDRWNIALSTRDGYFFIWERICVVYVHELQHALRLIGCNELANNFKVN